MHELLENNQNKRTMAGNSSKFKPQDMSDMVIKYAASLNLSRYALQLGQVQ
jgi:hypothetical protein